MPALFAVPNIIRGSTQHQNAAALRRLEYFIDSIIQFRSERASLLVMGCKDGDFLINELLPKLPDHIVRIVACDLTVDKAQAKYADYAPRITFVEFDIQDESLKINEKFNYVLSLWCVRWMYNQRNTIPKLINFLEFEKGVGCILFESYHYFYILLQMMAEMDEWRTFLTWKVTGLREHFGQREAEQQENMYAAALSQTVIDGEWRVRILDLMSEERTKIFRSADELQRCIEEQFTFGECIPNHRLEEFYKAAFDLMKESDHIIQDFYVQEEQFIYICSISTVEIIFTL